jgi:transposase-like protein
VVVLHEPDNQLDATTVKHGSIVTTQYKPGNTKGCLMICPFCNNTPQKRGFDDNGKQRYWCRLCNKWLKEKLVVEEATRKPNIFLFDIETLPLEVVTWGIHEQHISTEHILKDWCVLSWAGVWLEDEHPVSDFLTPAEAISRYDKRILTTLWDMLDKADIVIAHNGNGFDIPKVRGRFLYHGMFEPSPFKQVDTLQVARSRFGLTNNKLDFILKYLGYDGKIETNLQLWLRCSQGEQAAINEMDTYCRGDVSKLREVYMAIRPYMTNHPNVNLWKEKQDGLCPICSSDKIVIDGNYASPTYLYDAYKCNACGSWHRSRKHK